MKIDSKNRNRQFFMEVAHPCTLISAKYLKQTFRQLNIGVEILQAQLSVLK